MWLDEAEPVEPEVAEPVLSSTDKVILLTDPDFRKKLEEYRAAKQEKEGLDN